MQLKLRLFYFLFSGMKRSVFSIQPTHWSFGDHFSALTRRLFSFGCSLKLCQSESHFNSNFYASYFKPQLKDCNFAFSNKWKIQMMDWRLPSQSISLKVFKKILNRLSQWKSWKSPLLKENKNYVTETSWDEWWKR